MKRTALFVALAAAAGVFGSYASASSFTYHGVLQDGGKPAQGKYDIELTLFASPNGSRVIGGPLTIYGVDVNAGSFATEADFGVLASSFKNAYVGVKVRSAGEGEFVSLGTSSAEVATASSCPGSWTLDGNAGNPAGSYLGTADNQSLTFKVNNVTAGTITPGKGVAFGQGISFFAATAAGQDAFATGDGVGAGGTDSFAAGFGAFTPQNNSYMWGDAGSGITSTTAANQYIVRAGNGVAINGAPKDGTIELSIYPSAANGGPYPNIFLGNTANKGGILVSENPASGTTTNDAQFAIDQFDGTNQLRRFSTGNSGVTVNDAAILPPNNTANIASLSVLPPASANDALIDLYPHDSANPTLSNYWSLLSDKNELDVIRTVQKTASDSVARLTYLKISDPSPLGVTFPTVEVEAAVLLADGNASVANNLTVEGNAFKPGGGSWSATSDRRVKQDILPLENAVDTLLKLKPVSFHYTPEYRAMANHLPDRPYLGFVAQEFANVFPDAVTSTGQRVPGASDDAEPILALDPNPALITAVAAVQELAVNAQGEESRMRALENENKQLRRQMETLAARLNSLEHANGE